MTDDKQYLIKLQHESENYEKELMPSVLDKSISIKDILGFELKNNIVRADYATHNLSLRSCLSLYDEILIIFNSTITDNEKCVQDFDFKVEELASLAEKGRLIIGFNNYYDEYKPEMILPLLKSGIRYISPNQFSLLGKHGVEEIKYLMPPLLNELPDYPEYKDLPLCFNTMLANGFDNSFKQILKEINEGKIGGAKKECVFCYSMYAHRYIDASKLQSVPVYDAPRCNLINDLALKIDNQKCSLSEGYFGSYQNINSICESLILKYAKDMPLTKYLDFIDGNTTKAIREIVYKLTNDPMNIKYKQRLDSKIFELNQEMDELKKSKLINISRDISDIISYNLKTKIPEKTTNNSIAWLARFSLSLQAKLLKKDWATLQLYNTRKRIEKNVDKVI